MHRRIGCLMGLCVLIGPGLVGCSSQQATSAERPPVVVSVVAPKAGVVGERGRYLATLISRRSVALSPQAEGRVTAIFVRPGEAVAAGRPLVQIDPARPQADLVAADEAVRAARAEVEGTRELLASYREERASRQASVRLRERRYARTVELEREGAVSTDALDEGQTARDEARAALAAIEAQIRAQQAQVRRAERALAQVSAQADERRAALAQFTVAASFAGVVGDIPIKVGDYATTATRLLTVAENRPLEVNVSLPAEQVPRLAPGSAIDLIGEGERRLGVARVFFVSPTVDAEGQTVLVKALYPNTDGRLRADQVVQAQVNWQQRPGLLVPSVAVVRLGGQDFVFVAVSEQGKTVARQRPVELGTLSGNDYQVLSGLKSGERVITAGLLDLQNGTPIAVQP